MGFLQEASPASASHFASPWFSAPQPVHPHTGCSWPGMPVKEETEARERMMQCAGEGGEETGRQMLLLSVEKKEVGLPC